MSKYENYQAEDFLMDDYFIEWMQNPTPESSSFWADFKRENPSAAEELERAIHLYSLLHLNNHYLTEAEVLDLKARVLRDVAQQKLVGRGAVLFNSWMKVAATVLLLLAAGLATYKFAYDTTVKVETAYGERREITLPDQSVVTLNGNSSLRYNEGLNVDAIREVWLEGEAFFAVAESQQRQFVVHTADLDVKVLGTTFNVDNRESTTKVVLNTGSVSIHLSARDVQEKIVLNPGEMLEYKRSSDEVLKQAVNPVLYASWKSDTLDFDRVAVQDIAERLEERYGYDITIADEELGRKFFTGHFPSADIDVVIEAMEKALGMEVVYKGRTKMIWKLS